MANRLAVGLGALAVVGLAGYGTRGSLGLFIEPWESEFDATRASVSLISSLGFVALGLAQPIAGRLLESLPPRGVLFGGLALGAIGYGAGAFAPSLPAAIVLIGVVASFGTGITALTTLTYIAGELVERRQGILYGILTAASAGGQVLVLPVATAALGVSLRAALLTLGAILAAMALAVLALVPRVEPARRMRAGGTWAFLRDGRFWLLALPFFVCGYTTTGLVDTHLIPHALHHGLAETTASAALTALAAFNVTGVLIAGALTDRLDRGVMLAAIYAARAASLLALPFLTSPEGLFLFAAAFGLADFATVPPTTSLTRSIFRAGGWALAIGLLGASHQAGSALGAFLGGWLYDRTGTYTYSFVSAAVTLVIAAGLSYALRERPRLTPAPAPA
ncbi:MAG TPA: MFS transporter [Gaiellaceae bacterium]|nr:MFS transporter [Gaiellaceae bacterium]